MARALFRITRCAGSWALRRMGLAAVTMPWGVVYVLPEWMAHMGLIRHEMVHIEQIERDGAWKFTVRYLWWLLCYGYRHNPYEVEAYAREPIHG
jgi:hypothetical protein